MMRLLLVVEETGWFYAIHASVSEMDDTGRTRPVMVQDTTHAKGAEDGYEGLIEAAKAILFA